MKRNIACAIAILAVLAVSVLNMGAGWGPPVKAPLKVGAGQAYDTINEALAVAENGSTILVFPGTYDETINIEGYNGLTIKGWGLNVIIQPSTVLPWNIGGYTDNRKAAVRVVNSTNVNLENLVMDFGLVKGNNVFGILYFDTTGSVTGNLIKNMSLPDSEGYYYEIGSCFRAPGYSDGARAGINIMRNTFIDAGRVAVLTHNYVNANITGNVFYKTFDDFGYAIEMGSTSTGVINFNTIYGYDVPALSDNSNSGGIYVENCFTGPSYGEFTGPKKVMMNGNHIYNCQWAVCIGNEFDGYAGDIDLDITMMNNNFHDNIDGGAVIADEDMEYGSSVTVKASGNTVINNGGCGYWFYTNGDGDITADLKGEKISGQNTGVLIEDYGAPGSSIYNVKINRSDIADNACGLNNTLPGFTVDAVNNWWGDRTGPYNEALNPDGKGNAVSDNVNFEPWLKRAARPGFFPYKPIHRGSWNWPWKFKHTPHH